MRHAILACAFALAPTAVLAQSAPAAPPAPARAAPTLLSISAEHQVQVAPDKADITLGVESQAETAQAAAQQNAQAMNSVMDALRRARIADRDVQTSNLSLSPRYRYEENRDPILVGYTASNTVNVTVRDLRNLGRIMDAVVAAGGNQVQGVSFGVQNPDPSLDEARRQAFAKARARAELYAQAAGLRVSRIAQIAEGGAYAPPPPMPMAMARMTAMEAAPTPVSPGEVGMTANVNVVFELE